MKIICEHCKKELGELSFITFQSAYRNYNCRGRRKPFCDENCFKDYIEQYLVEEYNGRYIYKVDVNGESRYIPYWFSSYYFTTIEDCRNRMDMDGYGILTCDLKEN